MSWYEKYIGIPFEDRGNTMGSCDCYGIVRLVYNQELSINIPSFDSSCYDTKRIFSDYLKQIAEHWDLVEEYQEFDVVAMAYDPEHPRVVQHFGIYIGNGMMVHTLRNIGTFTCRIEEFKHCIKGVYRWKQLDLKSLSN